MSNNSAKNPLKMSDIKQDLSFFPKYEGVTYKSNTACFDLIKDIYNKEYQLSFSEDFLSKLKSYTKKDTNLLILEGLEKDFEVTNEIAQGDVVVINTPMLHLGLVVDHRLFFHSKPNLSSRFGLLSKYNVRSYHRYKGSNS